MSHEVKNFQQMASLPINTKQQESTYAVIRRLFRVIRYSIQLAEKAG